MTTDTDKLVESFADAFYEQLKHGDAAHQQWLRKETDKFFAAHAPAFRDRIIASLCGDVEPVAWMGVSGVGERIVSKTQMYPFMTTPLYPAHTVAALAARVAELEKDAGRYRWLRAEHVNVSPMAAVCWKRNYDRNSSEWVNTASPQSLDSGIDAAMAKD